MRALDVVILKMEKELKQEIENSLWHHKKFIESEALMLEMKNAIDELKAIK